MKYRIQSIKKVRRISKSAPLKAQRKKAYLAVLPPVLVFEDNEHINIDALFELGTLVEPKRAPRVKKHRVRKAMRALKRRIADYYGKKKKYPVRLSFYCGVLCSSVLCAALAVAIVALSLFGGFFVPYTSLPTPDTQGKSFSELEDVLERDYEVLVSYKHSDTFPAGTVISQSPRAGVIRKVYKNRARAVLRLTVSMGKSYYTVKDFSGASARDACLALKNDRIAIKHVYVYSDKVDAGKVISTVPPSGSQLYSGEVLTLNVSLGKEIKTVRVPDLYGLSEASARALLVARGLELGEISYKPSSLAAGKITEQQYAPFSDVSEGTRVNITVSLGSTSVRYVPDLYGMSREQAEKKLASVGLVLGAIYTVSSAEPVGTVIKQTPLPSTPITSTITSVDIYISG